MRRRLSSPLINIVSILVLLAVISAGTAWNVHCFQIRRRKEMGWALTWDARAGNVSAVRHYLQSGVDPNAHLDDVSGGKITRDATALVEAAERGHLEIVRMLIEHGARGNTRCLYMPTPLNNSYHVEPNACCGYVSTFPGYSDHTPANPRYAVVPAYSSYPYHTTALVEASKTGEIAVVRYLVQHGADVGSRSDDPASPGTALQAAEANNHSDVACLLRTSGARE